VGQVRAWFDEPERMGLPREVADLVVLLFAEQTNRSVVAGEVSLDTAVLHSLPSDAVLVEQHLPSEHAWEEARARAAAIFGISDVTELRTARNMRVLGEQIRLAATERQRVTRDLVQVLQLRDDERLRPGQGPHDFDRMRIATASLRLLDDLLGAPDDVTRIEALAAVDLPAAPLHVGKNIATAGTVAAAIGQVDWNIFGTIASWGPGHPMGAAGAEIVAALAEAWQASEWTTPLQPALGRADSAARALLIAANPVQPTPRAETVDEAAKSTASAAVEVELVISDASGIAQVAAALSEQIEQGRKIRVSWTFEA
jgi:hypothetical protein